MSQQSDGHAVGRFYTKARFFKQVLGSLPDGTKIPGGPYTYPQVATMLTVLIGGWLVRPVWSTGSAFGDIILLIAIAFGSGYLISRLPASRRSPLKLIGSAVVLLTHPGPGGRWRGKPIRIPAKASRIQRAAVREAKSRMTSGGEASIQQGTAASTHSVSNDLGYGSSMHRLLSAGGERKS